MGNRAYLYSFNKSNTRIRDLSEYPSAVPLFYKILLSADPHSEDSFIWYREKFKAIRGNCRKGLKKYLKFLDYLITLPETDGELLLQYQTETETFFEQNPKRLSVYFHLEAAEIYILDDSETPGKQNGATLREIRQIGKEIDRLLKTGENFFPLKKKKGWLWEIERDITLLKPIWQTVCYYSLNRGK